MMFIPVVSSYGLTVGTWHILLRDRSGPSILPPSQIASCQPGQSPPVKCNSSQLCCSERGYLPAQLTTMGGHTGFARGCVSPARLLACQCLHHSHFHPRTPLTVRRLCTIPGPALL